MPGSKPLNVLRDILHSPDSFEAVLAGHAVLRGSSPALIDGSDTVSYAALYERVGALRDTLLDAGVRCVAVDLENGIDWIVADLAGVLADLAVVPVPPYFTTAQRDHLFATAAADAVIEFDDTRPSPGLTAARLSRMVPAGAAPVGTKITFTSGSTGRPRGVVLSHESLFKVATSIVDAMQAIELGRHLCLLPLATLLENVAGVYAPLIKGIEVHVPPASMTGLQGSSGLDPKTLAACLQSVRPGSVIVVPQLLMALTTMTEFELINPGYLKMVAVGGGRVSASLHEQAGRLSIPVFEGYGLSEAGSVVTLNLPDASRTGSVGRVLGHAKVRVNAAGELEVSGVVMQGYTGEPPLAGEWLPTGDLAEIDDEGFVFIRGRIKNQFITAYGRNVNPEWVEAELMQQPQIAHALFTGEAEATNVAFVWPRLETDEATRQAIIEQVNQQLPDYARVHACYWMSGPLDPELITSNGRLKRQAMLEHFRGDIERHYATISSRETDH